MKMQPELNPIQYNQELSRLLTTKGKEIKITRPLTKKLVNKHIPKKELVDGVVDALKPKDFKELNNWAKRELK